MPTYLIQSLEAEGNVDFAHSRGSVALTVDMACFDCTNRLDRLRGCANLDFNVAKEGSIGGLSTKPDKVPLYKPKYRAIPKKSLFDIESNDLTIKFAWGIQTRYSISFFHVVIYHVLMLPMLFGVWIWWQHKHNGDMQNASIPFTIVLTLLSLF